jgi:hypothetical protein
LLVAEHGVVTKSVHELNQNRSVIKKRGK